MNGISSSKGNGNVIWESTEDNMHAPMKDDHMDETQREDTPLAFCRIVANYPRASFVVALCGHLSFVLILVILIVAGQPVFPVNFQTMPLTLDIPERLRWLAWELRNEDRSAVIRRWTTDSIEPWWTRGRVVDRLELFYDFPDGNVFTPDNLKRIESIETEIFKQVDYQKIYCHYRAPSISNCSKAMSILRYFDGTYSDINPIFNDPSFSNIPMVLSTVQSTPELASGLDYYLSKNARISNTSAYSDVTRSGFLFGFPLEAVTPGESEDQMRTRIEQFIVNTIQPRLHELRDTTAKPMRLVYISLLGWVHDTSVQALYDMMFAIGSFVFIFCFIWVQTRSLWVTGWAVFSVLTSFVCTIIVYTMVLRFRYVGYFHMISIYIILGIGADDFFVFVNTWQATGLENHSSLAHRLSVCYKRAAGTMFFTSLTTSMAFFSSGFSPLLGINSFGIFAGTLVAVNYVSVIVFFPTVVCMHHIYFEKTCCCGPCICSNKKETSSDEKPTKSSTTNLILEDNKEREKKAHPVVRFFAGPYFRFITHPVIRWVILAVFGVIIAVFAYFVSTLEPDSEMFKIYRVETNYGRADYLANDVMQPTQESGDYVDVYLVWGLKQRDVSGCAFSEVNCDGKQVWNDGFDMNTPPAQLAMNRLCEGLINMNQSDVERLHIRINSITNKPEISCFILPFQEFLLNEEKLVPTLAPGLPQDLRFPLTEKNMLPFMLANPHLYDVQGLEKDFYRYYEIGLSYWMSNAYQLNITKDYLTYNELIGEANDPPHTRPIAFNIPGLPQQPIYGTKLRYVAIRINTTMSASGVGYAEGIPIMEDWEKYTQTQMSQMPAHLRDGFQTSSFWHWLRMQESLVTNALTGIMIGISIAFPILVLATMNILVGLCATLNLVCITVCVVGVIPMAGWKLGVLVSMNLCLVVGLSVDYVVHLAEAYHLSKQKDRLGRLKDALESIAISILWGACTTLGAAVFMCFGQIHFFLQFGIFMFSTIGFSLIFSLGFFATFLGIFGPENDTGSLIPVGQAFRNWASGRKESDIEWTEYKRAVSAKDPKADYDVDNTHM
ncbi:unnamed protein product [Owenia fusiformis]|uniref:SSD domain-containing protein n=1 Tax=Owenia fusiformis TaxID=6347 RepID=A0A8S4PFX1_OWEFU|nr:unnamed protein product [Owenia fusiformis]